MELARDRRYSRFVRAEQFWKTDQYSGNKFPLSPNSQEHVDFLDTYIKGLVRQLLDVWVAVEAFGNSWFGVEVSTDSRKNIEAIWSDYGCFGNGLTLSYTVRAV